ncbi:MAG: hypothetical protein KAS32_07330 [Candidatus Peribacteraceae bacterium]|nr:hypothetical protein [Candidatus Peribacteraceae bacterium]
MSDDKKDQPEGMSEEELLELMNDAERLAVELMTTADEHKATPETLFGASMQVQQLVFDGHPDLQAHMIMASKIQLEGMEETVKRKDKSVIHLIN